jgi:hypothetical protein
VSWRRQLPVHSPLSLSALGRGIGAAIGGAGSVRRRVESWIQDRYGPRDLVLADSGTSALALAMAASVRARPGLSILLPAYSCYDLVTAAMAARVTVRWYDLDPSTLQPDIESLDSALEGDAAGVVIVHHYGIPVDLDRVTGRWTFRSSRPFLIEDAAQASGGTWRGRPLGAYGDLGILSFGRGKGMTGGGGGALLAGSERAAPLMDWVRSGLKPAGSGAWSLVSSTAQWLLARPWLYRVPASLPFLQLGETVFHPPHDPRHMSDAQVAVLSRTIDLVDQEIAIRRRHGARLLQSAGPLGIAVSQGGEAGYLRFPVLPPVPMKWPGSQELGVMPGYPVPLPGLRGSPYDEVAAPGAATLASRLLTFPVHSRLTPTDMDRMVGLLEELRDPGTHRTA